MSVDSLQEKIRKLKNPSVLELIPAPEDVPPEFFREGESVSMAVSRYFTALLAGLKGIIPAVRVSFSGFALLAPDGLTALSKVLEQGRSLGYYVILDAPELLSHDAAQAASRALLGPDALYPCDAVVIGVYPGSDVLKPFVPHCRELGRDVYAVVRTANRSSTELQDLMTGSRLVHIAAADLVNRHGGDLVGKFGYSSLGVLAAAKSEEATRNIRRKYPALFMLLDGYDYPNAGAKRCSAAFDRFGHGAAVCSGRGITAAWKEAQPDTPGYLEAAVAAAERMKKNLTRYVTVL